MELIKNVIDDIRKRGMFGGVERKHYVYNHDLARKVVMAIGHERTKDFAIDASNRFAYDNMIKWVQGDPSMQALDPVTKMPVKGRLDAGIYVAGNTGTGKSWLLEIMSAFCTVDNVLVNFGGTTMPLRWTNYRADEICDFYAANGTIDGYKRMYVIGIQDFGSEPRENLYMGNRRSVIGSLIECRGDRTDCLTLISSNYPINHPELEEIYGSRVVSRLAAMCNYFEIRGADRRKGR